MFCVEFCAAATLLGISLVQTSKEFDKFTTNSWTIWMETVNQEFYLRLIDRQLDDRLVINSKHRQTHSENTS